MDHKQNTGLSAPKDTPDHSTNTKLARYDPLARYINEIKRYPILTREREHELAVRFWKNRDKEAAFFLITSNLLLVVKLVMELRTRKHHILDLVQEGNIGLIEAIKRYDPFRDVRFTTYASWWIRAYIFKYILDNWRIVKFGTTNKKRKLFFNLRKEQARLEAMGIYPGPKLLAEKLDTDEKDIVEMTRNIEQGDLSLEAADEYENGGALIDILADNGVSAEEQTANEEFQNILNIKIEKFKKGISERERIILEDRLLAEKPATLQEIANRFDKTRESIRYTERKVMNELKAFLSREIPDLRVNLLSYKD